MHFIFALLILLFSVFTHASGPVTHFDHLSIEDGLSQGTVNSILQDRQGFLWFATQDGLNRYDGYTFKVFVHDSQDSGSISNSFIRVLYEDSKGRLWIGTQGGGLNRFDAHTERFVSFKHDKADPHSLSHNRVQAIIEDQKGRLWIGTDSGGLNLFDELSGQFRHFSHAQNDPDSLSHDSVWALLEDSKGHLWIGTDDGLDRLNLDALNTIQTNTSPRFIHYKNDSSQPNSLSHNSVYTLLEDAQGGVWVGTFDGLNRLNTHGQNLQFTRFKSPTLNSSGVELTPHGLLSNSTIKRLFEDSKGMLWVGTNGGGLNRYDGLNFVQLKHQEGDQHSLSDDTVLSIHEDAQGALWIGTNIGGLNKLDTQRLHFNHFKRYSADPHSLSHRSIRAIYKDSKGVLWIGTDDGLNQYNAQAQRFTHFKHHKANPNSISHNSVRSMHEDAQGSLWVGTYGGGLNRYDDNTERFVHFKNIPTDPHSLSADLVTSIKEDSKGRLWVGTIGGGLNQYNRQSQVFKHFQHDPKNPHSLSGVNVSIIFEDSKGVLWIGTYDGGLNQFDPQTEHFIAYQHQPLNPHSLSNDAVRSIYEDKKGMLWLGTEGGLNQFNRQTKTFTRYSEKEGLANNTVYGIVGDKQGRLWLSTNNGLSRFNPVTQTFSNFDVNDGLQSNEFNTGAYFKSTDGELFFGGVNGFNRFFAENIIDDTQPPVVVLTDLLLANQSVPVKPENQPGDEPIFTLPKAIDKLDQLTLSYQQNLISFEFAALHFSNPLKNQFAYQLEGQDKDWIVTDAKKRWATYTNLASGDYTLRVKASNHNGYWNKQGKTLKITVLPPLWKTWWAYAIYLLTFIGLTLMIVWVLTEQRKRFNERMVINQLQQVDKVKDEFLANTSHELRTPLNGIIGLAESLIDGVAGGLPAQANQQLAMVVSSGRRLANLVNDILDFAKLENHTLKLNPQPVDLYNVTDVVIALSQHLIGNKPLTLINDVDSHLPAVFADEERLQQILYNLVGNSIKFTEQGTIRVGAVEHDQRLKVSVTDSGIGIASDKFDDIFKSFEQVQGSANRRYGGTGLGLAVSKELVALHNSLLEVESTLGKGSTFSFCLDTTDLAPLSNSATNQTIDRLQLLQRQVDLGSLSGEVELNPACDNQGNGFRLLLVDDEPINRLVLRNHLSQQNYQLAEAASGEEALSAIDNNGPFDLVLLDVMMPKMSGYEVCEQIRQRWPVSELPVIFLTAKNQQVDVLQSFAVGGNDFLTKPVAKQELLARVETHLKLLDINRELADKVAAQTVTLVQSEKMASLGTLTAGVAHEINNPTNFVYVSALSLETDLSRCQQFIFDLAGEDAEEEILQGFRQQFDPLHEHLATIKEGANRIKAIVKDLRAFGQLDAVDKKSVQIADLLTSTLNLIRTKYLETTEFVTEFTSHPTLECHPAQLNQVFMNLVVNACDAIREEQDKQQAQQLPRTMGEIIIGCRQLDDENGKRVEISVKDNGAGMSEETKNKLFEPFYTTKGDGEGTGLGLSISFGIVQKHGGELVVESQLGVGTVFKVVLPCG
ncbi:MAG: signal transduction histidine kinase/ligand-binding sensor domain-containing protein [Alteromonadaceae bacterium]|jgi:signal transduction histidine kinase/ligand-binding sensor domain-containing protein